MKRRTLASYGLGTDDGGVKDKKRPTTKELAKKYAKNPYAKDREFWGGYLDEQLPVSRTKVKDAVYNAARTTGVNPALLYTSAMEEGMQMYKTKPQNVSEAYSTWQGKNKDLSGKYQVDGFYNYGLDRFGEEADRLIKQGYLKPEFKNRFTAYDALNEKKEKIKTAAFMSDEDALVAKAAMMNDAKDRISHHMKEKKYNLSDKGQEFFTLAAYNGGLGTAQKMLASWNEKGYLKDDAYLKDGFKPKSYDGVNTNIQKRIQNKNILETEGFFSDFNTPPQQQVVAGSNVKPVTTFANGGEVDWGGLAGNVGSGLKIANTVMDLLENNSGDQTKEPLVNATAMRTMVSPYNKFAMGGEADDAMAQLQAMADEQGISVEELIAQLQGGGEEEGDEGEYEEEPEMEEEQPTDEGFAVGGIAGMANINAEGGEVIQTPNGQVGKIKGSKHEDGGVDMSVPKGTKIYSDRVEIGGRTMQERKIDRVKNLSRLQKLTGDVEPDNLLRVTIARTKQISDKEEAQDMGLQKILQAVTQDLQKFAVGGYAGYDDDPTPNKALRSFLDSFKLGNTSLSGPSQPHLELEGPSQPFQSPHDELEGPNQPHLELEGPGQPHDELEGPSQPTPPTKENNIGLTTGDYIGMAGNAFNAIAPILNTRRNQRATNPVLNRFLGFGKKAMDANDVAQDIAAGTRANKQTDIDISANTARARNRNSATSVNTIRALDAVTDMGVNKARSGADDTFAGTMLSLLGQRGQIEMANDQAEMSGQEKADTANAMNTDNYFSQMGHDLTNFGTNIQGIGKAFNVNKSNNMNAKLIAQLSKYGLTTDEDGNLISSK